MRRVILTALLLLVVMSSGRELPAPKGVLDGTGPGKAANKTFSPFMQQLMDKQPRVTLETPRNCRMQTQFPGVGRFVDVKLRHFPELAWEQTGVNPRLVVHRAGIVKAVHDVSGLSTKQLEDAVQSLLDQFHSGMDGSGALTTNKAEL